MALTVNDRLDRLENRSLKLERRINQLITAINQLASRAELEQTNILLQEEIDDLRTTVNLHDTRLDTLEQDL